MRKHLIICTLLLASCAGFERDCSSTVAENFGSDWIVVQYDVEGRPFNCWQLHGIAITNERATDGIYWESDDGHLVHVSGWYNRVQVQGDKFDQTAKQVGVEMPRCTEGRYDRGDL